MRKRVPWHQRIAWLNWLPFILVGLFASIMAAAVLNSGNQASYSSVIVGVLSALFVCAVVMVPVSFAHRRTSLELTQLSDALSTAGVFVMVFDANSRLIIFNELAREFFTTRSVSLKKGMSENEIYDLSANNMFADEKEAVAWKEKIAAVRVNQIETGDRLVLQLDNSDAYHQIVLNRQSNGHLVEVRTDVTELKEQELALATREVELELSRNEAQASNRAKSEFLANMSHEIRTPMNGVIGMTELLLESGLNAEQNNYASMVSKSALALLTLINDILDFSKIEAGKLELDNAPFDLRSSIEDVASLLATAAQNQNIEVAVDYSPDLPGRFIGDSGRVRQVLTNLVGNAVKFTEKGHVALVVDGTVSGDIAELDIAIKDTGIGIPLDKQSEVFSLFEQVDGASNRRFEGTGLGLAISRRLVRLMGDDITLESEVGVGSVFSFKLKLPVDNSVDALEADLSDVDLKGKRVLIVDDLPLNCDILKRRVLKWGMHPEVAQSGKEAIRLATEGVAAGTSFDLAIFDFQMPEMDGHKLCQHFKATEFLQYLPIVLLSSVDQSVQGSHLNELGFAASLVKPVRNQSLHHVIRTAIVSDHFDDSSLPTKVETSAETPQVQKSLIAEQNDNQTKINILVVEDNPMNQMVVSGYMMKYNVDLIFADNGEFGVDAYNKSVPDLILMDVSMPVMNGMEATREIRKIEQDKGMPRCPIVALTANAMQGDREQCLMAGMDDFLTKPLLPKNLHDMLYRWLDTQVVMNEKAA